MDDVQAIYDGSDADATRALYQRLIERGQIGDIAINLLRACKASERAKKYRGRNKNGSYRAQAYAKKDWSIGELCRALVIHADDLEIVWGWGRDEKTPGYEDVLYVEVPGSGQVSFHTSYRKDGPDYPREWDGVRGVAASRIIKFATAVLNGDPLNQGEPDVPRQDRPEGGAESPAARPEEREEQQTAFGF